MTRSTFGRRGPLVLGAVAVLSMLATMGLSVFGDALLEPDSFGADGWSRSALGHRAFLELVRQEGRTVLRSRSRTAEKARDGAPTALLEPGVGKDDARARGRIEGIANAARRLIVVLPKREGFPERLRPGWIGGARYVELEQAQRVLDALGITGTVLRPAASVGAWAGPLPAPEVRDPQVLRTDELEPLVGSGEGMLVGERDGEQGHLIVVADPDLVETHGLGQGRNAELALALLDRLGGERTLVVDETLHGHEVEPSIVRELLRFPLVLATLQALATLGLLAWAAAVRFGRPVAEPPVLRAGKEFLVENVAQLLRAGGHAGEAARAFLRAAREEVLARVPPPGGAETPAAWLLRLEAARGRAGALAGLERQVAAIEDGTRGAEVEAVRAARRIQRWREELTHGARGDPREGRGAQG